MGSGQFSSPFKGQAKNNSLQTFSWSIMTLNWKFGHFMCCFSFYCAGKPVELETWNSWNCHFLSVTVSNYGRFQCYSSLSCSASCCPASHLRCSKSYGFSVFSHFTACPVQPASPIHFTYNKILLSLLSLSWYLAFVSSLKISTKLWHLSVYLFILSNLITTQHIQTEELQ